MSCMSRLGHVADILATPAICTLTIIPFVIIFSYQYPDRPKGCRRLGLPPGQSNLHDEYDPKYNTGTPNGLDEFGNLRWRVKALFTYPIKSCAGLELGAADVAVTGLVYDRQFCFAEHITPTSGDQEARWHMRTLRDGRFSKLALVRPEIWIPDPYAKDFDADREEMKSEGVMVVNYPRVSRRGFRHLGRLLISLGLLSPELSFRVPLSHLDHRTYPLATVKVWKDYPVAYDYGQHLPQSFHDFIDSSTGSLTLLRINPSHHRRIFRNAPRKEDLGFQPVTGFADAYPIHLLNLASVRDVASRCADSISDLSIRRFRANIIIQGPAAFEEDHWKKIQLQSSGSNRTGSGEAVSIHTVCRTVRCRLPNVDPDTGIRHPSEPDQTLRSYRRIDLGCEMYACLGMQLVPSVKEFTLRVNDELSVLETGEHFYIKMLEAGEKVPGD